MAFRISQRLSDSGIAPKFQNLDLLANVAGASKQTLQGALAEIEPFFDLYWLNRSAYQPRPVSLPGKDKGKHVQSMAILRKVLKKTPFDLSSAVYLLSKTPRKNDLQNLLHIDSLRGLGLLYFPPAQVRRIRKNAQSSVSRKRESLEALADGNGRSLRHIPGQLQIWEAAYLVDRAMGRSPTLKEIADMLRQMTGKADRSNINRTLKNIGKPKPHRET